MNQNELSTQMHKAHQDAFMDVQCFGVGGVIVEKDNDDNIIGYRAATLEEIHKHTE